MCRVLHLLGELALQVLGLVDSVLDLVRQLLLCPGVFAVSTKELCLKKKERLTGRWPPGAPCCLRHRGPDMRAAWRGWEPTLLRGGSISARRPRRNRQSNSPMRPVYPCCSICVSWSTANALASELAVSKIQAVCLGALADRRASRCCNAFRHVLCQSYFERQPKVQPVHVLAWRNLPYEAQAVVLQVRIDRVPKCRRCTLID
jgi:hypothetical protein